MNHLRRWAADWPLSAIGIPDPPEANLDVVLDSPPLRQLFVDRLLEAEETSRLADPRVREAVRGAWGMHPQLAPRMEAAASRYEAEQDRPPADERETATET